MKRWLLLFCLSAMMASTQAQTPADAYNLSYQQGIEAMNKKDYSTATLHFQKAMKSQPQNAEAALRLLQCALVKQDLSAFQQGIELLQKNQYKGLNAQLYLAYGQLAKAQQQYSIAIDAAQKGRLYDQTNTDLLLLEASVYKEQGLWLTAIQRLEQAAINSTANPHIFNELADAYAQKKDRAKAIENYKKTLNIEANNPLALANLGKLYLEESRQGTENSAAALQQSAHFYQQYLAIYPNDITTQDILKNINYAAKSSGYRTE